MITKFLNDKLYCRESQLAEVIESLVPVVVGFDDGFIDLAKYLSHKTNLSKLQIIKAIKRGHTLGPLE